MRNSLKLLVFSLALALSILAISIDVSAYGYWGGMHPMMGGAYGYGGYSQGYSGYQSSYGYGGPYSYQFVPGSFWGHYYNPGLYYSTLDYSLRNNQYAFSQGNLAMTYGLISQENWY